MYFSFTGCYEFSLHFESPNNTGKLVTQATWPRCLSLEAELSFVPCTSLHSISVCRALPSTARDATFCLAATPCHLHCHCSHLAARESRYSALSQFTHSSLKQMSVPHLPNKSRMSQLEGTRFIAQEGASRSLCGAGQSSQAVAQRSCLLAGPGRGKPGRCPCLHLQSLALPLSPSGPRGTASCHFPGMSSSLAALLLPFPVSPHTQPRRSSQPLWTSLVHSTFGKPLRSTRHCFRG